MADILDLTENVKGFQRMNEDLNAARGSEGVVDAARIGDELQEFSNFTRTTEEARAAGQAGTDAVQTGTQAMENQQTVVDLIVSAGGGSEDVATGDFVDALFPRAADATEDAGATEGAGASTINPLTKDLSSDEITHCNTNLSTLLSSNAQLGVDAQGAVTRNAYILKPLLKLDPIDFGEILIKDNGAIDAGLANKLFQMKPSEMESFLDTFKSSKTAATDATKLPYSDIRGMINDFPSKGPGEYTSLAKDFREGLNVFSDINPPANYEDINNAFKGANELDAFTKDAEGTQEYLNAVRKVKQVLGTDNELKTVAGSATGTDTLKLSEAISRTPQNLTDINSILNDSKGAGKLEISLKNLEGLNAVAKTGWSTKSKIFFFSRCRERRRRRWIRCFELFQRI